MVDLSSADAAAASLAFAAGDSNATSASDLSAPFLAAFGVTGVAVSSLGDLLGTETLSASDDQAARWAEIQLDLGEGPAWEAATTHRPVLVPNLSDVVDSEWPFALFAL